MARILVTDDDADLRATLQKLLMLRGYEVDTGSDGLEGARLLQQGAYDLLITDIVMPNQEGLESIIQAKKRYPAMKIIAMSGAAKTSTEVYLRVAKNVGADFIFQKPWSPKEMLAKVEEFTGSAQPGVIVPAA
jgi:DNA-binding response OmpR family regulator